MIRLMDEKDFPIFRENPFAVRICGLGKAYGTDARFALFWQQRSEEGMPTAWLSLCDGDFTLDATDQADFTELSLFLQSVGGHTCLLSQAAAAALRLESEERLTILRSRGAGREGKTADSVDYPALYALLQGGGEVTAPPPYTVWYPDLCHRIRHGTAAVQILRNEQNQPVAAAVAAFCAPQGSLLSGVVVSSGMRGQGLGRQVVDSLRNRLPAARPVFVLSREKTVSFYRRLSFAMDGRAAVIRM